MTAAACASVAAVIALVAVPLAPRHRARRLPVGRAATRRSTPDGHDHRARTARGAIGGGRAVAGAAAVVVAAAVAVTAGVLASAVLVAAAGLALAERRRRRSIAARRAIAAALPDAIEFLVLLVHAGLSPTQAIVEAAGRAPVATRPGFAAVTHRLGRGHTLGEALHALTDELGPSASPIADGIAAADRYGLPLAPVLDSLSEHARAARRRLAEADARRLPVRLSFPLVVCTLPSFALLGIVPAVMGTISSLRDHPV